MKCLGHLIAATVVVLLVGGPAFAQEAMPGHEMMPPSLVLN
jgi:hypothetical protein